MSMTFIFVDHERGKFCYLGCNQDQEVLQAHLESDNFISMRNYKRL